MKSQLRRKKNSFVVIIDQRSGLYLQEHRMYGSYSLNMRVILTNNLHDAKLFRDAKDAVKHLQSRMDYREPVYDWKVQGMEAAENDENVYPVRLTKK